MRQQAKLESIPLPDAEVTQRCTIVRANFAIGLLAGCPDSICSRVTSWANSAPTLGLDLIALGWPDENYCFALVTPHPNGSAITLAPAAVLAAYRHALCDPKNPKTFQRLFMA